MKQTEWRQVENECFEESLIVMNDGQKLLTIRRWDKDTKDNNCKDMYVQPMGNIRVSENSLELFFTPHHISRKNLERRVKDYLSLPLNDVKSIFGFKGPTVLGLFPKKFKSEIQEYLNGNEDN